MKGNAFLKADKRDLHRMNYEEAEYLRNYFFLQYFTVFHENLVPPKNACLQIATALDFLFPVTCWEFCCSDRSYFLHTVEALLRSHARLPMLHANTLGPLISCADVSKLVPRLMPLFKNGTRYEDSL